MTCEQESNLPVYARERLQWLRDKVRGLEHRLQDQDRVHAYDGGRTGDLYELDILRNDMRPLPDRRVRLVLDQAVGLFLDVTTQSNLQEGNDRALIRSAGLKTGTLDVRPEACNSITVGVAPW